jgi:hypothetical protein
MPSEQLMRAKDMTTARELVLMAASLQRKKTDAYGVARKLAGMGKAGGVGSATLTSPAQVCVSTLNGERRYDSTAPFGALGKANRIGKLPSPVRGLSPCATLCPVGN